MAISNFGFFSIDSLFCILILILVVWYIYNKYLLNDSNVQKAEPEQISFSKKPKNILLSAKEKLEMSWKFLYQITEEVINKFSQEDKKEIIKTGMILFNAGMRYEHVIEYAVNHELQKGHEKNLDLARLEENNAAGQSR